MDRSGPSQSTKPRKELNWWHSFNSWWRDEYDRLGRRPRMQEVDNWYHEHAERIWGADKPSLEATRDHAKCLRSKKELREYFQRYNAKKQLGRPFTDLRHMRGSRQRSGSKQGTASTQSPGSISDPGGGGGGTSGGTSGGLSAGMSGHDAYCDGSSGGGDASGGTAATQQTVPSQPLSAITESQIQRETANRALPWEPERDQGQEHVERDVPACYGGDGAIPAALASALASVLNGDALLLGPGQGSAPGRGGAGRGSGACDSAGDPNGTSRPTWVSGEHQHHMKQQTNESGFGLGAVDMQNDASAEAGCAGRSGDIHNSTILNSQTQPSCNGNSECVVAPAPPAQAGLSTDSKPASVLNAQAGLHRIDPNARQGGDPVVPSYCMQAQHPQACQPSIHVDTAAGPGTGGGSSGNSLAAAAAVVGSDGAELSPESCTGNMARVTRWLAGLTSNALGQQICFKSEVIQGMVMAGSGEMGPVHGCSSAAPSVAPAVLDGEVPEPGALIIGLACHGTENDSVPSPPAAAPPPPLLPSQQQAPPTLSGNARGEEPEVAEDIDNRAVVVRTVCKSSTEVFQPLSSSQDAAAVATVIAPAAPSPDRGMVDGGYDAEECYGFGRSTTPSHEQQQHHPKYHLHVALQNDSPGASGVDSAGQVPTRSGSGRASARLGIGSGDNVADGTEGGGPSAFMIHNGCEEEPVELGPGEPSLSALLDQSVEQMGDVGTVGAAADAHALPLSCRSSDAFTGAGAAEPSAAAVSGSTAAISVGSKRSAGSLGLLRAPSLCAPDVEGEPETPNLHRAPKLLRLEQVQQAAGRLNVTQRGAISTSGVAAAAGVSGHKANPGGVLSTGGSNAGPRQIGNNGAGGGAGPVAAIGRGPSTSGPAPAQGASPPIGLPPDPFRTPMLLFQRSTGKDGMAVQLGSSNGLTSAPSLLLTTESVSTRGGMPPPPPLLPRESVGTANVPLILTPRDSLEARLMPPLPLHERSSAVCSLPSNATAAHHPTEHPQEMLQRQLLQQQLLHKQHEQHKLQQQQQQASAHAAVHGSGLDDAGRAGAIGLAEKGTSQAVPLPLVRDGGTGGSIKGDGKAPVPLVPFSFPTPSPGLLQETALTVASCQPAPSGASDRVPRSVPILLQSGDVERMCLRQSTDDGRIMERPLQVITMRLTLPAASLGALRQVLLPPSPPPLPPPSGQLP